MPFFTWFYVNFGTIRKNKISFSNGILQIFSHKSTLVGIPPV